MRINRTSISLEKGGSFNKGDGFYLRVAIAVVFLVAAGVYLNTLQNDFVYDDRLQILEDARIRDFGFIPKIFLSGEWGFGGQEVVSNFYRPMTNVIRMMNYHIFGREPWGYHLTNIIFHSFVSVLVFIIARRLLAGTGPAGPLYMSPAFIAGLLFATHPAHTEAVAWISAVTDLSYSFFCLLSFYFYMRSKDGSKAHYVWSVFFFAIALLCKEPAVMLPAILMVYDYAVSRVPWSSHGIEDVRGHYRLFIKRHIPFLAVLSGYVLLRLYALGGFAPQEKINLTAYGYIINVFPIFAQYLQKLILPVNLNAYHVLYPLSSVLDAKSLESLTITAVFVVIAVISFRSDRMVFFSLSAIILPLLPALYVYTTGPTPSAERHLYLPSFGFVMLVVLILSRIRKVPRKGLITGITVLIFVVAVLYSVGTIRRNMVWKDEITFYSEILSKSPELARVHMNLGFAYYREGRFDDANREYNAAMNLMPQMPETHNNIGLMYAGQNLLDEAIDQYKTALELKPDYATAHFNLGNAYAAKGLLAEAVREYKSAIDLDPEKPDSYNNLGLAYIRLFRFDEAINEFKAALELNPISELARVHMNLGLAYYRKGNIDDASRQYKAAMGLMPQMPELHNNIGLIYADQNRIDEAIDEYKTALKLRPGYIDAHYNLGNAYTAKELLAEAVTEYKSAIDLDPNDPDAHNNLGLVYVRLLRFGEAIDEFNIVMKLDPYNIIAKQNIEKITRR